jgi:hypothetical protein
VVVPVGFPVLPLRLLLGVLQGTLDPLSHVADLGLGGTDVLLERALGFLRAIASSMAGDLLRLANTFLHPPFDLVFVDSHDILLKLAMLACNCGQITRIGSRLM